MPRGSVKDRVVVESIEDDFHERCVDLFSRPDGSWGFEEFRKDVEDGGYWTAVSHYADRPFVSQDEAHAAALTTVQWLRESRQEARR